MIGGNEMNMPAFSAEASLYKPSTHYNLTGGWASAVDVHLRLTQLASPIGGITCDGACPPHCHVRCGPCAPNSSDPSGCARSCVTSGGPDCDPGPWVSECEASACCTQPPICGPCTGQTCSGTYPNCAPTPGTGTQSCTACGRPFTRSC